MFSEAQIVLFEYRYKNGYNIPLNKELVIWMMIHHLQDLTNTSDIEVSNSYGVQDESHEVKHIRVS